MIFWWCCFPDSSYSLGGLLCCVCIWSSSHLLQCLLAAFRWKILFVCPVFILVLSLLLYEYICSTHLAPSSSRILKSVYLLLTSKLTSSADSNIFCFPNVAKELKFVVSPIPADTGLFSAHTPSTQLALATALEVHTRSWLQSGGRCGFGTWGISGAHTPVEGISVDTFPMIHEWASC